MPRPGQHPEILVYLVQGGALTWEFCISSQVVLTHRQG